MYWTEINTIEIPYIADAAYVLSLRENNKGEKIFNLRSIYMDPTGECAISYYGHLSERDIKEVMINFCYPGEDKCYNEIHPKIWKNYTYEPGNRSENKMEYTVIYTPDGLDYRTIKV